MRKILLSTLLFFFALAPSVAQENLVIKKKDGTLLRYDIENDKQVQSIRFDVREDDPFRTDLVLTRPDKSTDRLDFFDIQEAYFERFLPAEAVDLGLSVKWASWNMGASSATAYGPLYGWGDPTGDNLFAENPPYELTNICGNSQWDIATAQWGDGWRLPTLKEWEELENRCTWNYEANYEDSGITGIRVTGPSGKSIFLPFAGNFYNGRSNYKGRFGYYWTGEARNNRDFPFFVNFAAGMFQNNTTARGTLLSVRPVYGPLENEEIKPVDEDADAVDMGLNVRWHKYNLGATTETGFGNYYFWADSYYNPNGTFAIGQVALDPILNESGNPIGDIKGTVYDPTTALLSTGWRMPTQEDFDQLINLCTWVWYDNYNFSGVSGYEVKGPSGAHIFLPAAGQASEGSGSAQYAGISGNYWSSQVYGNGTHAFDYAWYLNFESSFKMPQKTYLDSGFSIRPVKPY